MRIAGCNDIDPDGDRRLVRPMHPSRTADLRQPAGGLLTVPQVSSSFQAAATALRAGAAGISSSKTAACSDSATTPCHRFVADSVEVRDALAEVATLLAPQERAAAVLKDVFDLSLKEIAAMLDTTEGAVKAALHRGRGRLADPGRDTALATCGSGRW